WENQVVIRRRPAQGLLGGLWEFPVVERAETEPAKRVVGDLLNSEFGPGFDRLTPLGTVKHAYTHFKIEVSVFLAEATDSAPRSTVSENGKWINISELETYPFSKYNLRIIELLRKHLDPS
nr:NUDIX domain-containing protein [Calditrichia bacterium]